MESVCALQWQVMKTVEQCGKGGIKNEIRKTNRTCK